MITHKDKKMGLSMAIIVGMNAMIGAGVFMIPERLQRTVGPAAIFTYLFVIGAIWSIAYSLARVAQHYPHEGSFYAYVQAWGGKALGLTTTFLYIGGLAVAMGLLTQMTGIYLHTLFPGVSAQTLATGTLALLAGSLLAGTRILHWGQIVLIILTLLPLLIISILCFLKGSTKNLSPFLPYGIPSIFRATKIVIFGFFGFESATALHALVENPERTVPRAITWSIIIVSLIYVTFVASTFLGIPRELALQGGSLSDFLYALFPEYGWLITFIVWSIIVTIMGTIHALLWSLATLLQSLSTIGAVPFKIKANHAVIALSTLVWIISVSFKSIDLFFNVASLCIVLALACAIVPLACNLIPGTSKDRIIARIGLLSAAVICAFSIEGIWNYIVG